MITNAPSTSRFHNIGDELKRFAMKSYNRAQSLITKSTGYMKEKRFLFHMLTKNDYLKIFFLYCSYLSSIHEKANCIAIFWTGRPHSLGSCHFRDVWATCLPHKGGGIPLSALPKDTTSELAGLFSTISHKCQAPSREAVDTIF